MTLINKKVELHFLLLFVVLIVGLAIGTSMAAFQALAPCLYSEDEATRQTCDLKNWQTLVLEGIAFVAGAGIIFFYLQRKNSMKTEQLIEEVGEYIRENKKLISTIKGGYLYSVQTMLAIANEDFKREKKLAESEQKSANYAEPADLNRRIFMYVRGSRDMHLSRTRQITAHVNFLKSHIDPLTISEIENAIKRIGYLCEDPMPPHFADVNAWLSFVDQNAHETEKLYDKLEDLIKESKPN